MRKVSKETARAFKCARPLKVGNSMVRVVDGGDALYYLHGNRIGSMFEGKLCLSDAGWKTVTTKERLNAILEVMELPYRIYQESFGWFARNVITGEVSSWNGNMIFDVNSKELTYR
jgi:hypothetical protein